MASVARVPLADSTRTLASPSSQSAAGGRSVRNDKLAASPLVSTSSVVVPAATTRPSSSRTVRSQRRSASSMSCVLARTAAPSSASRRMATWMRSRDCGSTPAVGSSSKQDARRVQIPAARFSRRRMPPEYCATGSSARPASPTRSSARAARAGGGATIEAEHAPEEAEVLAPESVG